MYIYFWLCWVFVSVRGPSPAAASGGHSPPQCAGLSPPRPLPLRSAGSVVVAHGPSRSAAYGSLPDQGSNPRPLHWQADSQPLRHQGRLKPCPYKTVNLINAVCALTALPASHSLRPTSSTPPPHPTPRLSPFPQASLSPETQQY